MPKPRQLYPDPRPARVYVQIAVRLLAKAKRLGLPEEVSVQQVTYHAHRGIPLLAHLVEHASAALSRAKTLHARTHRNTYYNGQGTATLVYSLRPAGVRPERRARPSRTFSQEGGWQDTARVGSTPSHD